jgi:hypothetical protein
MIRILKICITLVLTSFFFFPIAFTRLPGPNSKMMLAVVGLVCVGYQLIKGRSLSFPAELLGLLAWAGAVSLFSLLSVTLNQTPDTTYATYIISFSVWLSAAYAVCCCIKGVHGRIDVPLVLDYLVGVCVIQCILALVIDNNPTVARWVNTTFEFGQIVPIETKRLYGIGAELDVAGARFSAVLAALGFYLSEITESLRPGRRLCYILAFFVIAVIGNFIARTTLVGAAIGLVVIVIGLAFKPAEPGRGDKAAAVLSWLVILTVGITVCVVLYNTDPKARQLFRFGFEGFFSLAEQGRWEVTSNDTLQSMIVFPESLHTWLLGDGYFMNSRYDPNYLGDATDQGYYMGTDVGYLRFIFYFGVPGLLAMMGVIIYSTVVCARHFRQERFLFVLALLVGLVVWFKVSTDIFLFFALFLSAAALREEEPDTDAL